MLSLGETDKAGTLFHQAVAEYRQISNQPRWELGVTLLTPGVAAIDKQQPNQAEEYLRESEQILRHTLGDKSPYLAYNLDRQAAVLIAKNKSKAAEEKARQSLGMYQAVSPDNKYFWATPMRTLGEILTKTGRLPEGQDYYQRALTIYEQQPTRNHLRIIRVKLLLSQSLLAQNRLAQAERLAIEARDEAQQHLGEENPTAKAAATNLAKLYEKEGKREAAQTVR